MLNDYKIGDVVKGTVNGIQAYGIFVALDEETQGLVHISECRHGYIDNVKSFIKIGETVEVRVIDIDEFTKKMSLSMRVLEETHTPQQPLKRKWNTTKNTQTIGFSSLAQKLPHWIEEAKQVFVEERKKNNTIQ